MSELGLPASRRTTGGGPSKATGDGDTTAPRGIEATYPGNCAAFDVSAIIAEQREIDRGEGDDTG